jgi:hypothetical protein
MKNKKSISRLTIRVGSDHKLYIQMKSQDMGITQSNYLKSRILPDQWREEFKILKSLYGKQ